MLARSTALTATLVAATVLGLACGPAGTAVAPSGARGAPPAALRGPDPGQECAYMEDRASAAFTRLRALAQEGSQTAAKFGAIADVLDQLAAETGVAIAREDVRALASEYQAAARTAAAAARDVAALLAKGEHAKARLAAGAERKGFLNAVLRVADACRGSAAPDCARAVEVLRSLGAGVPRVKLLAATRRELAGLVVGTPALRAALPDADAALARLSELLAIAETLERDGPGLVTAYQQAVSQFRGLNRRGNALCRGANPR